MAVAPPLRTRSTAVRASPRVTSVIFAIPACAGYTIWATLCPLTMANHVPSTISPTATRAARRAAAILVGGISIEPDVSMMMISAASPVAPALPAPVQLTDTTA